MFPQRVWLNLETIKLAYHLFDFVIGPYLQQQIQHATIHGKPKMYNDLPACEYVLQYMLKSMSGQGERRMYISALTDICLLFDTLDVISTYETTIIFPNCSNGREKQFLSSIQDQTIQVHSKLLQFKSAFSFFDNDVRTSTFTNWKSRERRYQCIRVCIFKKFFAFKSSKGLKEKLESILFPKTDSGTTDESEDDDSNDDHKGTVNTIVHSIVTEHRKKLRITVPKMKSILSFVDTDDFCQPAQIEVPSTTTLVNPYPALPSFPAMSLEIDRWKSWSIVSRKQLDSTVSTALLVNTEQTLYILKTAPLEIYSARLLKEREHWRTTIIRHKEKVDLSKSTAVTLNIPSDIPQFIDNQDNLHVVRPESGIFQRHAKKTNLDVLKVMQFCMMKGDEDTTRRTAKKHRVMNFGIKVELESDGVVPPITGSRFFLGMDPTEIHEIKTSIGSMIDLIWNVLQSMQLDAKKPNIGGNRFRNEKYGVPVRDFFFASESEFENITLAYMLLFPVAAQGLKHLDVLNDIRYCYSQTRCLNIIIIDNTRALHLLQVLGNFRGGGMNTVVPKLNKVVSPILRHFDDYRRELRKGYQIAFGKSNGLHPIHCSFQENPFELQDFFWTIICATNLLN